MTANISKGSQRSKLSLTRNGIFLKGEDLQCDYRCPANGVGEYYQEKSECEIRITDGQGCIVTSSPDAGEHAGVHVADRDETV